MKNVADYYNKTATGWSDEWLKEKKQSAILEKFHNCFAQVGSSHPRLLDLGCGAGYDSKIMNKLGARVTGIDISEKLIETAKGSVPSCKFYVGDINEPMTKLGKFDGVVCLATIIHVDITKMKKVMQNIADVLKKGGLLLLSCCDGAGKNYQKSYVYLDGEYYANMEINKTSTLTLENIANKVVLVKIAGEDADMDIEITRNYEK